MKYNYIDFLKQDVDGPKQINKLMYDSVFLYKLMNKILKYFPKYRYINLETNEARLIAYNILYEARLTPMEFVDIASKYSFINKEQSSEIFPIMDSFLNRFTDYYFDPVEKKWFPSIEYLKSEKYLDDFTEYYIEVHY